MLRNYLITALRNLVRNRLYAAINIIGLTVGFAAALLIAIFVRDELTYDRWIPDYQNIYRIAGSAHPPGGTPLFGDAVAGNMAPTLKQDIPGMEEIARLRPETRGLRHKDVEANEIVVWADPEIFAVLALPAIAGDLATSLQNPDSVVITRAVARKYFGRDNVVGETMDIDRQHPMQVTAVLEDLPSRTHLDIRILASGRASFSPLAQLKCCMMAVSGTLTYLKAKPGAVPGIIDAFPAFLDRHNPSSGFGGGLRSVKMSEVFSLELQPLAAIHMISAVGRVPFGEDDIQKPSGERSLIQALTVVGSLVVLVALANYVNLMTARASRRAVEVGVRKTSGAERRDLMFQFLGESFLYVGASVAVAVVMVLLCLPAFGTFLGRTFAVEFGDLLLIGSVVGFTVVAGLLGGLYPAFILSAFRPAGVLKAAAGVDAGARFFRQALVVGQFAVLAGLIVATLVIERQTNFAINARLTFESDELVFIKTACPEVLKNRIAGVSGVRGAACAGHGWIDGEESIGLLALPNREPVNLYYFTTDPGLLELYGVQPLAGRLLTAADLQRPFKEGPTRRVINEAAMRRLGYPSAAAAVGQVVPDSGIEIVGVVPDFPLRSLRNAIAPTTFTYANTFDYLIVKLDGARVGEALQGITRVWDEQGTGNPISYQFYRQHVQEQYLDIVRQTQTFASFSVATIVIACLGLFGLAAFTAEQRTKEIGVRKALGANLSDVLRLLVWRFVQPVLWANLIAWPVAYLVMNRWLQGFAYHIDLAPWMFLVASALALVIAIVTVLGHALLVARAQPVTALRYE